jgi:hypothetical protein
MFRPDDSGVSSGIGIADIRLISTLGRDATESTEITDGQSSMWLRSALSPRNLPDALAHIGTSREQEGDNSASQSAFIHPGNILNTTERPAAFTLNEKKS